MRKNLNDVPWSYEDGSDKPDNVTEPVKYWQSDPNHNVEPKGHESDKPVIEYFSNGMVMEPISDKLRNLLDKLEQERVDKADKPMRTMMDPDVLAELWADQSEEFKAAHPLSFTELDEPIRIISEHGKKSIGAFLSTWGYVGNPDMTEDLTRLLETVSSDDEDIFDILDIWGIADDSDRKGMSDDLRNMLKWENNPMARESGTRVERYFLTKQGEVYQVTHITDIPECADNPDYAHILAVSPTTGDSWGFVSNDGMLTMVTATLHFTRTRAMESIREDIAFLAMFDDAMNKTIVAHVYELDTVA